MKNTLSLVTILISLCINLFSQSFLPFATNINSPLGVEVDNDGMIWVIEGGTGNDDGKVWRFTPEGEGTIIISDLPSFFNPELQELNGALNIVLGEQSTFYVVQGEGPSDVSGSIMEFDLEDYDNMSGPLTPNEAVSVLHVSEWVLANGFAESNPYSFVKSETGDYIISDAAANAIFRYDQENESFSVLATFSPAPNPLPFGPPFIDAVPTKIMNHKDGGYLVSSLTGFPFIEGAAKIYHVTDDGTVTDYLTGLTLVTDMAIDPQDNRLIINEFARFGQMGFEFASAQLQKVHDDKSTETIAGGFGPSPGIGIAPNGNIYSSHLFLGHLQILNRCLPDAGTITSSAGWTQKSICATDGIPDPFDVQISESATSGQFVITDESGVILGIQSSNRFDLEGGGVGTCFIYYVAHDQTAKGLETGQSIWDVTGCHAISNALNVERLACDGCHTPLNVQARPKSTGGHTITWNRVRSAQSYTVQVVYEDGQSAPAIFNVRRNRVVITASSDRNYSVSVRANCGSIGSSDFSDGLIVGSQGASSRSSHSINAVFEITDGSIALSPNPASEFVHVQLSQKDVDAVLLTDLSGRVIATTYLTDPASFFRMNIGEYAPGVYLIVAQSKEHIVGRSRLLITK